MLVKLLVIGGLVAVLISLGVALMRLIRNGEGSDATVRALTLRVALSIGLFVLLMIAYATGWLTPHGIFVGPVDVVPQASFGSGRAQGY